MAGGKETKNNGNLLEEKVYNLLKKNKNIKNIEKNKKTTTVGLGNNFQITDFVCALEEKRVGVECKFQEGNGTGKERVPADLFELQNLIDCGELDYAFIVIGGDFEMYKFYKKCIEHKLKRLSNFPDVKILWDKELESLVETNNLLSFLQSRRPQKPFVISETMIKIELNKYIETKERKQELESVRLTNWNENNRI